MGNVSEEEGDEVVDEEEEGMINRELPINVYSNQI